MSRSILDPHKISSYFCLNAWWVPTIFKQLIISSGSPHLIETPPHLQTYISGGLIEINGASAYISLCWSSTLPPTLSVPLLCYQSQCCSLPSFGLECCMSAFIWIVLRSFVLWGFSPRIYLFLFISSSFIMWRQFGDISPCAPTLCALLACTDLVLTSKVEGAARESCDKVLRHFFTTYFLMFKVQLLLITHWLHFIFKSVAAFQILFFR